MELPAPDFWNDYLDGLEMLSVLDGMRDRVLEHLSEMDELGRLDSGDFSVREVIAVLDALAAKRNRIEAWVQISEQHLEESLQAVADVEDEGRVLFLEVSRRVRELGCLSPQNWAALSDSERCDWQELLADYERLRGVWREKIAPGELPPWGRQ